jgi:hypothetical protein
VAAAAEAAAAAAGEERAAGDLVGDPEDPAVEYAAVDLGTVGTAAEAVV